MLFLVGNTNTVGYKLLFRGSTLKKLPQNQNAMCGKFRDLKSCMFYASRKDPYQTMQSDSSVHVKIPPLLLFIKMEFRCHLFKTNDIAS